MQFHLIPMTSEYAHRIVTWRYEDPYAFYNYDKASDHILNDSLWGNTLFAVLDDTAQLVGELTLVNACADFAVQFARLRYHYTGETMGLDVYQFNQRAIRVYERAGFVKFTERRAVVDGQVYPSQRMKKQI